MVQKIRSTYLWSAALFVVIVLNGFVLFKWTGTDTRPTAWDESIHTQVAYEYIDRIPEKGLWSVFEPAYFNYPPLYHLMLATVIESVDDPADAGAIINYLSFSLLLIVVFLIGWELRSPLVGFTAAFLLSAYPIFVDMLRITLIDVTLTAWVALAVLFLLKSDGFKRLGPSILFGITFGLAMLTKWTAVVYLCGPIAWHLWLAVRNRRFKIPLIALGCAGVLMAPWYLKNTIPTLARFDVVSSLTPASEVEFSWWLNWLWYPLSSFQQMSLVFALLVIPGIVAVYWKPRLWPFVLWVIVPIVLFTFLHNRNVRYMMPVLPAAALLSVLWIPKFRHVSLGILNGVVAIVFLLTHFSAGGPIDIGSNRVAIPIIHRAPPIVEDWKHREIINTILNEAKTSPDFFRVLTVSNAPYFHSTSLNVTLRQMNVNRFSFRGPSKRRPFEFAEFILLKTGSLGPGFTVGTVERTRQQIQDAPEWFGQVFKVVDRLKLPDGSESVLYAIRPDPQNISVSGLFNLELDELKLPNILGQGVKIHANAPSGADAKLGKFDSLTVAISTLTYKDISFNNVRILLDHPQVNLPLYLETQDIQLLRLKRLVPQGELNFDSLYAYLNRKADWLKNPHIEMKGSVLDVSGAIGGIVPVSVSAQINVESRKLKTRLRYLKIFGIPFPSILIRSLTDQVVPLTPYRETPFVLDLKAIEGMGNRIRMVGNFDD